MTQMENMIEKVWNLTEKGKLKWSITVNPRAFRAALGKQSVAISKHVVSGWEDVYILEVRNHMGLPIAALRSESYQTAQMSPDRRDEVKRKMKEVFDCASESAVVNGLAEIIDKLDEMIAESNRS